MIHQEILDEIKDACLHDGFLYPYYEKYSIAEIAPTLLHWFGVETARSIFAPPISRREFPENKKIVLFMIDGLGYDHVRNHARHLGFFKRLDAAGDIYPITSVFPSTTPAALTTIQTGFTPQEHGLPEWTVYFEEFDRVIETIPFKSGTAERDSLLQIGGKSEMLYEGTTVYDQLFNAGIKSHSFNFHEYAESAYSSMLKRGSKNYKYKNQFDLMEQLRHVLETEEGPSFYFVYWSKIDEAEHRYGPESPGHVEVLEDFSNFMEQEFLDKIDASKVSDITLLLTADHGQASIRDEEVIYLNQYLPLEESYLKSVNGFVIPPTGSPHDVFLFIRPDKVENVHRFLAEELKDKAEVITVEEGIKRRLFGINKPSVKFLRRVGNLLVLPRPNYHVWYRHAPGAMISMLGMHGGLSEQEMIVPFGIAPLEELVQGRS